MFTSRVVCIAALTALLAGCASSTTAQVTIQEPEHSPDQVVALGETERAEPTEPTEERQEQASVNFSYPDGWTQNFDQEQNLVILQHGSGSTISFTIWPLEQATPFEQIFAIWESMMGDVEQGVPIELGEPTVHSSDEVEATYMISMLTVEGGQRITLMHVAFVTNHPEICVLISGIWPESMNAEMLATLRQIAQSIQVSIE